MEDSDREDLYNLFKLLIEKIDLISRDPIILKIYIKQCVDWHGAKDGT